MPEVPTYADAAILIALTWGGDPQRVLAATDHINAGYAEYSFWVHACAVLRRLGLLAPGEPLPMPTTAGREAVGLYCPSGTAPRIGAARLRDALATMPILAEPIAPPHPDVIAHAIEAAAAELRRQFEISQQRSRRDFED